MNKRLFLVLVIAFLSLSNKVNHTETSPNKFQENEKILWSKLTKLKWEDFKGVRDFGKVNVLATTQCEVNILNVSLSNGLPDIKNGTYFVKNDSWTITNDLSSLEHEQAHFDINELYSRKIRKEFKRLNKLKIKDIEVYQNLFYKLIEESELRNIKFDNEVYFNLEKQNLWIINIAKELEKLSEYELEE